MKFIDFLGNFPVYYAALFINRAINNSNMTLLMVLHHNHANFLDASGVTLIPGTLPTLNLPIKSHLSSG